MTFTLTSTAFAEGAPIPTKYTCDGADVSPPLAWSGAPANAKSFALICDDPDAPRGTWVHWVLYNLPPDVATLGEGTTAANLPPGTREGVNDWKRTGYRGPCPPIGRHRYFFKLYALDAPLGDLGQPTKTKLEEAMRGHVVGQAQIVGTYEKGR